MKPIIVDMKDISDSTEVYESKPNRFLIYTIYLILFILIVAVLWMCLFKIDIVVKCNGVFKGNDAVNEISSGVTGNVKETYIENGRYVKEGDILYVLDINELSGTILRYQDELQATEDRLEILSAYKRSLDGDEKELDAYVENPYYEEFADRRELLYANISINESDTEGKVTLYQGNVASISDAVAKYHEKIDKLDAVKQCVIARNNTFDASESIYYSMVSSYLASYSYTALQYDNRINEYQRQIDECEEQINDVEDNSSMENESEVGKESISSNDITTEAVANVEELKKQRDTLSALCDSVRTEKAQALMNLELQQITTIEQQISGYNDAVLSLETNLVSAKLQLDAVNDVDNEAKEAVAILAEKGNVDAEILSYEEKKKECETYLWSYGIQNDNCIIKANVSGYFYDTQDLKIGSFVQEGAALGFIYPETESKYYAEIYVENSDIARIRVGQEVKFEIAAYPSNEYGYFEGTVENISKDISVDQSTGYSYYLVKVQCDNLIVKGKDGEEATLMNGMECQAKIVVDEKKVFTYFWEKLIY